ncbi:MAG: PsbP-related protein [Candidatus Omnitrophica bacterium]|nr:PsbP-related protein [Candidatus Omnitrophota bacterium]
MKKLLLSFILVFMGAVLCYSQEQKTFTGKGPYFEYSIEYPSTWKIIDAYGFVELLSPVGDIAIDFKEKIKVMVADVSKKPRTIEEFNDLWLKVVIPGEISDFELLEKGKSTIDSKETLFLVYKGTREKTNVKGKRYVFADKTNIYEVEFETKDENFDKNLSVAEAIIKSIRVK